MKKIFFNNVTLVMLSTLVFLSVAFAGVIIALDHTTKHERLHSLMVRQIDNMTTAIHEALMEVYGVQTMVLGAQGRVPDLATVGEFLIHEKYRKYVRNVLIAPNGIVEQVYPLQGNELVLGVDLYSEANKTSKEARTAFWTKDLIVTGPYTLVQGGLAITGRVPVRMRQADGTYQNWGLASITLAFPDIIEGTATDKLRANGYVYRIKKRSTVSGEYEEILNYEFKEGHDCERVPFSINSMDFELEAYPTNGWYDITQMLSLFIGVTIIVSLVGAIIQMLVNKLRKIQIGANYDKLTGLYNRASGEKKINSILARGDFEEGAFLLLDIDNFKSVNDKFGHQCGDTVLAEAACILKNVFRESDVLCRLGGDEFVVFMPFNNDGIFIESKIAQLLQAMKRQVSVGSDSVTISCSIGAARAPHNGTDFTKLYENADKALYKSKAKGRNSVTYC